MSDDVGQAVVAGVRDLLPVLRERDFDGQEVSMTKAQLDALKGAFESLATARDAAPDSPFEGQDRAKRRLFKRLQYLS